MDALAILRQVSDRYDIDGPIADIMRRTSEILGGGVVELETGLLASSDDAPPMVREVCGHILEAGGKRIRPAVCLMAFRSLDDENDLPIELAMSCELLHNASLLHDDVIDEGDVRRGRPSARVVHGNALSILGGDFLLMKCVDIVSRKRPDLMPRFVETLRMLVEGEVVQLSLRGETTTTESQYFSIIEGKTASLFAWASEAGATAAGAGDQVREAFRSFGWHVGTAFQLIDDALDFSADANVLGKGLLSDIGEGKMTLPVILAAAGSSRLETLLGELVNDGDMVALADEIGAEVRASNAIELVKERASEHTANAIQSLTGVRAGNPEVIEYLIKLSRALLAREN